MPSSSACSSALEYGLDGTHLAIVASGDGVADWARELSASFDCRMLHVSRAEDPSWIWLGGSRLSDPALPERLAAACPPEVVASLGEPGDGLAGWRLTHRQANAAFSVAAQSAGSVVRYRDVALLCAAFHDDLLRASLQQIYAKPLTEMRDSGRTARETLLAFFAARRNVSATAAALGISRQAVNNRLRTAERQIARPIDECIGELGNHPRD